MCLEGLDGVHKIADDILIVGRGKTFEEAIADHDKNIVQFLKACQRNQIKLNKDKFQFKLEQVDFIGHVLTSKGLKADPSKIEAITHMDIPSDVNGVQRLMGMVKYLAKFLPDLSDISEPIRRLTHKDTEWYWSPECSEAFNKIKEMLTHAPVLKFFDPNTPTEGQGDASDNGLGFALLQNGQPVSYASRALRPAETRYSQIEKELLAQVFGLERNHYYVYGRRITLWTDHKPLVSIYKKPLSAAPKRLKRLLTRLKQYDVEIRYKPGKEMYLADTLSRAYLPICKQTPLEEELETIHMIDSLSVSQESLSKIQAATAEDTDLQVVKRLIEQGWPEHRHSVPLEARAFFHVRDELAVEESIIYRGSRCVVPKAVRTDIRKKLHRAHLGVESTLRRARECVYWPGMNSDLKDYISKCDICNSFPNMQAKEPLISHDIPERPWEKIGVDFFTVDGADYLCTVDYYSDYFEIDKLSHKKDANTTIKRLKSHFATHGIPLLIVSDNGPPFNSREFHKFTKEYELEHVTSSPEYPQSNGKVESAVKIAKRLIRKTNKDGTSDLQQALLEWRNTPTEGLHSSPAQRIFGRRTRTLIPIKSSLLKPKSPTEVTKFKKLKHRKQKTYYDRSAKELPSLNKGDTVRVKPHANQQSKEWKKAQVLRQVNTRSYKVQQEDGRIFIRNRKHLKATTEPFALNPYQPQNYALLNAKPSDNHKDQCTTKESVQQKEKVTPQEQAKAKKAQTSKQPVRHSNRERKRPSYLKDFVH